MKKAVITGPTGSIGMALIDELLINDYEVAAVVRPGSKRADRISPNDRLKVVYCDLSELDRLKEKIEGADVFYHFGWDGTFGNSRNNMYGQNQNVKYALDAVLAAESLGCSCFIGAGSQAEYGRFEGKLSQTTPVFPENGYGMAKLCAGQMTRVMCEERGIRHIWTRILSVYGPFDGPDTMIMSNIRKLLNKEKCSCTAGEQMWDYLYSKDAALAMYLLAQKGVSGKTYCIGSGKAIPLRQYIEILKSYIDADAVIGFGDIPYSPKQVMHLCADISDLEKDTGFMPRYDFTEGIRETIEWYKAQQIGGRE